LKYLFDDVTGESFEAVQGPKMTEFGSTYYKSGFNIFNKASALNGVELSGSMSSLFSPDNIISGALH
jgi:hypothetical protein